MLERVLQANRQFSFVLDGLDECRPVEKRILLEQLTSLQKKVKLRLCISVRKGPNTALGLKSEHLVDPTITSMPEDNPEIESFIDTELESCIESEKLVLGDPSLILEIQAALLNGSQGMFLWSRSKSNRFAL